MGRVVNKYTDESKMPFGEHEGKPLEEVPADYLLYIHRAFSNLDPGLKAYIDENFDVLIHQSHEQDKAKR